MTATVTTSASAAVSPGLVTFCDATATYCVNSALLGTAQLTSSGTAVLRLTPGIGAHSYVAIFNGTSLYTASGSGVPTLPSVTVTGKYATSASLTSTGSAGNYNLAATVAGTGSLSLTPTGTLTFQDASNSNYSLGTASLVAGTLSQTLTAAGSVSSSGATPAGAAIGDFNNDGKLDIAVAFKTGVTILIGNGDGTFTAGNTLTAGTTPTGIAVGDFNSDGNLDLAVTNYGSSSVSIFTGQGNGQFNTPTTLTTGANPNAIAVADFNGDGIPDLAVTSQSSSTVSIFLNNGSGIFTATANSPISLPANPSSIVVGDFNGNGTIDLAITDMETISGTTVNDGVDLTVLLNDGTGNFTQATGSPIDVGRLPSAAVVGDFNGDGILDIAVASANDNVVRIFTGTGTGAFTAVAPTTGISVGAGSPNAIAIGDFNGDGIADITVVNPNIATVGQTQAVLLGNGNGTFQAPQFYQVGLTGTATVVGDFNGDGYSDIATPVQSNNTVAVLLDQITQTATASLTGISDPGAAIAHAVDVSYPGDTNFNSSLSGSISLTGSPILTSTTLSVNPSSSSFGQQISLTATLSPYSLGGYTTNTESVTFYNGTTKLSTAPLSGGVATLNLTALPTGADSLTVVYPADNNFQGSTSASMTYNVAQTTPTITWTPQTALTYGTLISTTSQLNATASVAGSFTYSIPAYTLLPVGNSYTLTATFTPTDTIDYTTATASVTLTVTPATPVISWGTPAPITFGTQLSNVQLDATVTSTTLVPLASYYNVWGITNGSVTNGGFDGGGIAYTESSLGTSISWNGVNYLLGPVNAANAVSNITINLPQGYFATLNMLGALVNNATAANTFIVNYTTGPSTKVTQSLSDWVYPLNYTGESNLKCDISRTDGGGQDDHSTCVYGYQIALDHTRIVTSITMPATRNVVMLAMGLTTVAVPGTLAYTPTFGTTPATGTDTLSVAFTPTDTADYTSSATATVQQVVTAATPYIVWPTPTPISYGTPLSATQLDASAVTATGVTPVPLSTYYRVNAIFPDGTAFATTGFDNANNAFSSNLLGSSIVWNGITFPLGQPGVPDAVSSAAPSSTTVPTVIALPSGSFTTLSLIGAGTSAQTNQIFTITYTDGTTSTASLSLSSWTQSSGYAGETIVSTTAYRDTSSGGKTTGNTYIYGYQIPITPGKTVVSITLPQNRSVVIFGMALSSSTSAVIPVQGTYTYTPASGTVLAPGTQALTVNFQPNDTTDYTPISKTVYIVVNQQTLVVTATSQTVPYGTPLAPYTYTITGFAPGDSQASVVTGSPVLTTTPATLPTPPPVKVPPYPLTVTQGTLATNSDYTFQFVPGTITITQANPVLTWNQPAPITYGTALSTGASGQLNATVTGSIPGTIVYTLAGKTITTGTILAANTTPYTLTATFTPTDTTDYTTATATVTLTVNQKTLVLNSNNETAVYGATIPPYGYTLTGFVNGDTQSTVVTGAPTLATTPPTPANAGAYLITPGPGTLAATNYVITVAPNSSWGYLTITAAKLTVTANNTSRPYGAANPTFTATTTGAVGTDSFTYTFTTPATATSPVNTYSITPSAATGPNLSNYTVVYVPGTLTVGVATLTVTANNTSRPYGAANPTFTATTTGAVGTDSFTYTFTTPATATSPVNTYSITPSAATGPNLSNYTVVYVPGTLTVGVATLTVTANNTSRPYGAANPTFTATTTGAVGTDSFTYTFTTPATATSPVNTYSITPSAATGPNLSNYTVVYIPGTLTVGVATLTVTANNASRPYGAANPTFTATATGALPTDTLTYTASTTATTTSEVGTYSIVPAAAGPNLADYNVVYINGTLTIGKVTPVVTWPTPTGIAYGVSLSTSQLDATASVPGTFAYTPAIGSGPLPVGTDTLTATFTPTDSIDYTTVTKSVTINVSQRTPTLLWPTPVSIPYGTALSSTQLDATAVAANGTTPVPGTFVYAPTAGTYLSAGSQQLSVTFTPTDTSDYTTATKTVTLSITTDNLTIAANSFTRLYGIANPVFTGSITGMKDGDTFTESFGNTATITSQPGIYPILPAASGANLSDYTQVIVDGTLTINQAPVVVTTSVSAPTIPDGLSETLTANVASTTTGTPTGTVQFLSNGNPIGIATLSNGVATFATTSLPLGTDNILAVYSGDVDFLATTASASSGTVAVTVTPLDFTFTVTSPSTVEGTYGTTRQYTLHVAPIGWEYPGAVSFAATTTGPLFSAYTFSPATVGQSAGAADITFTVDTRKLASAEPTSKLSPIALGLFLIPLFGIRFARRSGSKLNRILLHSVILFAALGAIGSLTGCGSGYYENVYPITVTATSGGVQHTVTVNFHIDQSQQ